MRDEVFFSLHELNERIAELLEKFNNRKYSQLNISRREMVLLRAVMTSGRPINITT
jgi:hypothetical protein